MRGFYIMKSTHRNSGCDSLWKKSVFIKIEQILYPYPQTPSPREGAILLGLPPLDQARMLAVSHTKPLHDAVSQMAGDLYGGLRPKARMLWLLAKSFARCKTSRASNARHPFLSTIEVFRQTKAPTGTVGAKLTIFKITDLRERVLRKL